MIQIRKRTEILKSLADNTLTSICIRLKEPPTVDYYRKLPEIRQVAYLKIYGFFRKWVEKQVEKYIRLNWEESRLIKNREIKTAVKLIGVLLEDECRQHNFLQLGQMYFKIKYNNLSSIYKTYHQILEDDFIVGVKKYV